MHLYRHHIGDYAAATSHLSFVEDAAYCRLLRIYYSNECMLPLEIKSIQRLVVARTKEEKEAVETILKEFFVLTDSGWSNKRADLEIADYQARAKKNREVGKLGGRPKKSITQTVSGNNPDGLNAETQTVSGNNPTVTVTVTSKEKEKDKKENTLPAVANAKPVSIRKAQEMALLKNIPNLHTQIAADWLQVRNAKKTPLTATALAMIEAQATKAGLTTAQAIAFATGKGWAGFSAKWFANEQGDQKTHAERTQDFKNQQAEKFFEPLANMTDDEKREWGFA